MEDQQAVKALKALMDAGQLKIITSEIADHLKDLSGLKRAGHDPAALKASKDRAERRLFMLAPPMEGAGMKDPNTHVLRVVTRLDGPNERGNYRAYTDDGSYCEGAPDALLRRLQEWRG